MKNLIIMMNALKHYGHEELIHQDADMQEMLSQDISRPAYRKLMDRIHAKHFRTINRK